MPLYIIYLRYIRFPEKTAQVVNCEVLLGDGSSDCKRETEISAWGGVKVHFTK